MLYSEGTLSKGSFLNQFLEEHQCAELVDEPTPEAIIAGLNRVTSDASYQQRLTENARQAAAQFHGPTVVQALKSTISHARTV